MKATRILYRTRQFWHGLRLSPTAKEMDRARSVLNPAQFQLFLRMQPSEQSHCLSVFDKLCAAGESNLDLLVAALLHDVGKVLYPLAVWERVWIVLGKVIFPQLAKEWGAGSLENLNGLAFYKRAFVVAKQHPHWGADLAAQANSSSLVVSLIHRHQHTLILDEEVDQQIQFFAPDRDQLASQRLEGCLLQKLQAADDES